MTLGDRILSIQSELKAPKNQLNSFGKYNYRSCEDILEALKPLLHANGLTQTISDDIINVGDRYYIRATVTVTDGENEKSVTAFAREPENKKGMDESQITGTASSYARKYALNGIWLIDDTKDADTDEHTKQTKTGKPEMTPNHSMWKGAVTKLSQGKTEMEAIKHSFDISEKNEELLKKQAKDASN